MKIFESFCLWSDLLGYGSNFYNSNWDIRSEKSIENIKRISNLQPLWLSVNDCFSETLFTLNDGLVRNYDLPNNNFHMILDWLVKSINKFNLLNQIDVENGFPGIRGVISYGKRIEYVDSCYTGKGEFIQTTPQKKEIYNKKIVIYSPSELQMNTAFSKAYIIEGSGSKMGVAGNKLYIDYSVIDKIISIANSGITDKFLTTVDDPLPPACYKYFARFNESETQSIFTIETTCNSTKWISLKIIFDKGIEYKNEKQSIITKLYHPIIVEDRLYSSHN